MGKSIPVDPLIESLFSVLEVCLGSHTIHSQKWQSEEFVQLTNQLLFLKAPPPAKQTADGFLMRNRLFHW